MMKHLNLFTALSIIMLIELPAKPLEPLPSGVWTPPGWSSRRAEFQRAKDADRGAIVFYGDSITEGWTTLAADFPGAHVVNRGISGDLASNMKFRIQEDVIDLGPKAVVLLIGTNDVKDGRPAPQIVDDLKQAVKAIHDKCNTATIIVCELMPRFPREGMDKEKQFVPQGIPKVNLLIEDLRSQLPYIYVCDTFDLLANQDSTPHVDEFMDGVHPNQNGYKKWKAALMKIFLSLKLCPVYLNN